MITDKDVIEYLENTKYWTERYIKDKEILNYLLNRYSDSESISETYYRIKNNIDIRPVCPICGNKLSFFCIRKTGVFGFSKHCCYLCSAKDPKTFDLKCKTREEHFGDPFYNNRDKYKKTCQEKYGEGVINSFQSKEVKEQSKKTKLERYGNEYYNNSDKVKETNLKKLGVEMPFQSKEVLNKCKESLLNVYGVNNPGKSEIVKEKMKQTCLERYGVEYSFASKKAQEKSKRTSLERYGVEYAIQSKEVKDKLSKILRNPEVQEKIISTKKKNGSFGSSKVEKHFYAEVLKYFPKAKTNFRTDKYQYNCDVYIPEIDLYIELNYFWTHGFHEFNENDIKDINRLNSLKERSKPGNMYEAAIDVWTIRDKEKIKTAKENNLNYLVFWNYEDGFKWLNEDLPKIASNYYDKITEF